VVGSPESTKQPQRQAQQDAGDQATGEGEVKGKPLSFNQDVPGQPANPGNLWGKQEHDTTPSQDDAEEDERTSKPLEVRSHINFPKEN